MSKSGSGNQDTVSDAYPYHWSSKTSNASIEEFVKKYKPSMVQDDGEKPWLWVENSNAHVDDGKREEAVAEATNILKETTERVQKINDDESIPTRSNKKTGAKSKKQLREEIQAEVSQKLKDIHKEYEYKSGKWLIFVPPDMVDTVWSRVATSVATGPLSETAVYLTKVSTTPPNESSAQRLICVYMPDVFDQVKVTEVMRLLLRNHGLNLSGVKSNLFTEIGLDSKHPSHIQSTIWKNTDLLDNGQIKELKDAFYADLKANQEKTGADSNAQRSPRRHKPIADDPFGSDNEETEEEQAAKTQTAGVKRKKDAGGDGQKSNKKKR